MSSNPPPVFVSGEPIIITKNISYITIRIIEMDFNVSATLLIQFFESNSMPIKNEILKLTPEQYSQWGNDDSYILDLICQTYNLTLVNP